MSVEYWNKQKEQWLPSILEPEDIKAINALVGWEMYREAE